jgi:hypothetical protein
MAVIGVYGAPVLAIAISLLLILQGSSIRSMRARIRAVGRHAASSRSPGIQKA